MIFKQVDEILSGRKTQTRRLVKPDHNWLTRSKDDRETVLAVWNEKLNDYVPTHGPRIYEVGKTYAVQPGRGKPAVWWNSSGNSIRIADGPSGAIDELHRLDREIYLKADGFQPARIRITAIRQEPLQVITEADAKAEGVGSVEEYRRLWESINGKTKGARWEDSPLVWVLSFELVKEAQS